MARRRREGPDHVDILVGQRIRAHRRDLKLSLEGLAASLGITHQQMQKYETGGNRITIAMLYQIAVALRVPLDSLWSGLPPADEIAELGPRRRSNVAAFLSSPDAEKMAAAYAKLPTAVQRRLADLAGALVDHGGGPLE